MTKRLSIREKRKLQEEQQQQQPQEQTGQGFRAYTRTLKQDTTTQKEPTTKITLRVTEHVARLIDEVYGKKNLRGEVGTKYQFIGDILQPYLEAEQKRLLELEIQDLEAKKQQLVDLAEE